MKNIPLAIFISLIFLISCKEDKSQSITISKNGKIESTTRVISPQEMYDALKSDSSAQLVDVRTAKEYGVNHLKDAQNICVTNDDFEEKVKTLDKSKPVYVYCKRGGRSAKAAKLLNEMGFVEVYDLQGGIMNWEDDHYPVQP